MSANQTTTSQILLKRADASKRAQNLKNNLAKRKAQLSARKTDMMSDGVQILPKNDTQNPKN